MMSENEIKSLYLALDQTYNNKVLTSGKSNTKRINPKHGGSNSGLSSNTVNLYQWLEQALTILNVGGLAYVDVDLNEFNYEVGEITITGFPFTLEGFNKRVVDPNDSNNFFREIVYNEQSTNIPGSTGELIAAAYRQINTAINFLEFTQRANNSSIRIEDAASGSYSSQDQSSSTWFYYAVDYVAFLDSNVQLSPNFNSFTATDTLTSISANYTELYDRHLFTVTNAVSTDTNSITFYANQTATTLVDALSNSNNRQETSTSYSINLYPGVGGDVDALLIDHTKGILSRTNAGSFTEFYTGVENFKAGSHYIDSFNNVNASVAVNTFSAFVDFYDATAGAGTGMSAQTYEANIYLDNGVDFLEFVVSNALGDTLPGFKMKGLRNFADLTTATTAGLITGDMFRIGHLVCVVP